MNRRTPRFQHLTPTITAIQAAGLTVITDDDTDDAAALKALITQVAVTDYLAYWAGRYALGPVTFLEIGRPHPQAFANYITHLIDRGAPLVTHPPGTDDALADALEYPRARLVVGTVNVNAHAMIQESVHV